MYTQTIVIGGDTYGPISRGLRRVREEMQRPPSYAWCCPVCGEIWARSIIFTESGEQVPFQFLTAACEEHLDTLLPSLIVPGSLLLPMEMEFNKSLPFPLWVREFHMHDQFTRKNHHVI